ncbi:MAG: hypothetical protein AAGF85_17005, partial [Bacteroidota bacterium]
MKKHPSDKTYRYLIKSSKDSIRELVCKVNTNYLVITTSSWSQRKNWSILFKELEGLDFLIVPESPDVNFLKKNYSLRNNYNSIL